MKNYLEFAKTILIQTSKIFIIMWSKEAKIKWNLKKFL